jgi:steroid 5-alpha reductase family enzyme
MHPLAQKSVRGDIAIVLTIIWGIRLSHTYFRREDWKFGTREDWRYTKMASDFGKPMWYFMSFLNVGVA